VAEGGGLLNRTGSHQAATRQAKTRDFLSIFLNLNSVLCLPMCREASRSLHNLLRRAGGTLHGNRRCSGPVFVSGAVTIQHATIKSDLVAVQRFSGVSGPFEG
jgi:hypothetical protein